MDEGRHFGFSRVVATPVIGLTHRSARARRLFRSHRCRNQTRDTRLKRDHGGFPTSLNESCGTIGRCDAVDYIAFDPAINSLWVPGGNPGAVDVVDVATGHVRQIPNLPTSQVQAPAARACWDPLG